MPRPVTYQTSPNERGPRIAAIIYDADPTLLQELVEAGARNVAAASPQLLRLAEKITEATAPESPCFAINEEVSLAAEDPSRGAIGKVADRYLNEKGGWEYQVRFFGAGGTHPITEGDIAPAASTTGAEEALTQIQTLAYDAGVRHERLQTAGELPALLARICGIAESCTPDDDWTPPEIGVAP